MADGLGRFGGAVAHGVVGGNHVLRQHRECALDIVLPLLQLRGDLVDIALVGIHPAFGFGDRGRAGEHAVALAAGVILGNAHADHAEGPAE